ncbi:unnamed protein product [Angiostrongylus costaricensis]|uniref:Protein-tyrosine sulfotransferase n=1 Tax=Angiostrongylus costaricensis TaxID=334426 RepID=A0A0R3PQU1_ANGCS|nr:unnamed protein product [Angiostrongylus costaricensis]
MQRHSGDDDIKVAILARDPKIPTCKLLEAFWIKAKNPTMNSREECPKIRRDLAPYLRIVRQCGEVQTSTICDSERLFFLGGSQVKKAVGFREVVGLVITVEIFHHSVCAVEAFDLVCCLLVYPSRL